MGNLIKWIVILGVVGLFGYAAYVNAPADWKAMLPF